MILTAAAGNSLMEPTRRDRISKIVSAKTILLFLAIFGGCLTIFVNIWTIFVQLCLFLFNMSIRLADLHN